ncbi:BA14K family protein [Rhizobium sp. BK376]|jgi:hypothetical protein|uniref:BA14K family protein n=1 Tax=Rhizobium sp. BK376 TaxID=2512149 RepID=UPI0010D3DB77|nr:BA14K family protein [Rhizobium sp. BK376]TCR83957.1 BA14K-like protein [Rhizobium sp. BK376]
MRTLTSILAGGLSVLTSLMPISEAHAITMPDLSIPQFTGQQPEIQQVQWHGGRGRMWHGNGGWGHGGWHGHGGGWYGHGGGWYGHNGWYGRRGWYGNGWGYGYYPGGYYGGYYGDAWVPLAAFATGAIIAGAASRPYYSRPYYNGYGSHAAWCASRYRSYRAYDNTFQPYYGPRRQC